MKLLAVISQHGLGHLSQAGPVLNALAESRPELELTIWSGLTASSLAARIGQPFAQRADAADIGLIMADAVNVDIPASHDAYLRFHADWDSRVAREADWLRAAGFDGVFSNVAYLPLMAAARAGIPAIALCSLNWFDIAGAYLRDRAGMARVLGQIAAAYDSAQAFLQATPAMPMPWLARREAVPPIAGRGTDRRRELHGRLGIEPGHKLVLVGFGGIAYRSMAHLPRLAGVTWLVPDDAVVAGRNDLVSFRCSLMPFLDLLASCDALLTKVGYGGFVEAVSHAVPVLYVERPDWPETPALVDWLSQHGNGLGIPEAALFSAEGSRFLAESLARLWSLPGKVPLSSDGAACAARRLIELIG